MDDSSLTPFELDIQKHTAAIINDLRFAALVLRRQRNTPLSGQFVKETINKLFPDRFIHFNEFNQQYDGDFFQFMKLGTNLCWRGLMPLERRKVFSLTYSLLYSAADADLRNKYAHSETDELSGEFTRRMSLQKSLSNCDDPSGNERLCSAYNLLTEQYNDVADRLSSCPIAADILKIQYLYDAVRKDDSMPLEKREASWIKSQMLSLICDGMVMTRPTCPVNRAHVVLDEPLTVNSSDDEELFEAQKKMGDNLIAFGLQPSHSVAHLIFNCPGWLMKLVNLLDNEQRGALHHLRDQFLSKHQKGTPEFELIANNRVDSAWLKLCKDLKNLLIVAMYQCNRSMNSETFPASKDIDQQWLQTLRPCKNSFFALGVAGVCKTHIDTIFEMAPVPKEKVRHIIKPALERIKECLIDNLMKVKFVNKPELGTCL